MPRLVAIECPCCKGAKRLTVTEHDDDSGRTILTKPICTHCMGDGVVAAEAEVLEWQRESEGASEAALSSISSTPVPRWWGLWWPWR